MNDVEFIDGLRRQDPAAARFLNECYVPMIWRFVFFRVNRDSFLAEDIVAETVLALVTAAASEMAIEHPGAWLRTVAQRRIHDHYRAAARVAHMMEHVRQTSGGVDDQDPVAKHEQELKRESVRTAMDGLSENYRLALEWKYVDRFSVKRIADQLGTTEKSAESILYRARQELRNRLRTEGIEPPKPKGASMNSSDPANANHATNAANSKRSHANPQDDCSLNQDTNTPPPRLARET